MTEEKNEIREVAKYSNDFNAVPLKDFSLVQKKILMTLIWLIKETDGSDITIDYDRFISLAQSKPRSLEEGIRLIRQTFRKILSLSITEIETETSYEEFMLFTARKVDKKNGEITVRVNPDYFSLIKDFANEYTKFPLQIGNSFSKQYTIDIYKFLRQFADTGFWVVTVENFKRYLAIPDSYGATKIREKIINPALEELKKYYPNLRLEEVKAKGENVADRKSHLTDSILIKKPETRGKMISTARKQKKQTYQSGPNLIMLTRHLKKKKQK